MNLLVKVRKSTFSMAGALVKSFSIAMISEVGGPFGKDDSPVPSISHDSSSIYTNRSCSHPLGNLIR